MNFKLLKSFLSLLIFFLVFIVLILNLLTFFGISITGYFSNINSNIRVVNWDLIDKNDKVLTLENRGVFLKEYRFVADFTVTTPIYRPLRNGSNAQIKIPVNEKFGRWTVANTGNNALFDTANVMVGNWRINNNRIEIVLNSTVNGLNEISFTIRTPDVAFENDTIKKVDQNVNFGGVIKKIGFNQGDLIPLDRIDNKIPIVTSNTDIRWLLHVNDEGPVELTNGGIGKNFTIQKSTTLEDKLVGKYANGLLIVTSVYLPVDLTSKVASNVPFNYEVTQVFSEVKQNANEVYHDFKDRVAPLHYGIHTSSDGVDTVVINFGDIGANGITYTSLKKDFAKMGASYAIDSGYYPESDRKALEQYFVEAYGDNNVINGHSTRYGIYFVERFDKVNNNAQQVNTAILTRNNLEEKMVGKATLVSDFTSGK